MNSARPSLLSSQDSSGVGVTGEGSGLTTRLKVMPLLKLHKLLDSSARIKIVCGLLVLIYGLVRASRGSPMSA